MPISAIFLCHHWQNARGVTSLSPFLFILFLNDITYNVDLNSMNENDLIMHPMYLILFADEIVFFIIQFTDTS
jgi:hypothetical protein